MQLPTTQVEGGYTATGAATADTVPAAAVCVGSPCQEGGGITASSVERLLQLEERRGLIEEARNADNEVLFIVVTASMYAVWICRSMSSMVSNGPRCVRNSNGGRTIVKVKMGVASTIKLEQMERSGEGFFFLLPLMFIFFGDFST